MRVCNCTRIHNIHDCRITRFKWSDFSFSSWDNDKPLFDVQCLPKISAHTLELN